MCERALLRVSCPARWAAACCCRHMRCGVVGQWWLCFLAASKQRLLGCGQPLGPHGAWRVVRGAGSRPHVALVLHTGVSCNCMAGRDHCFLQAAVYFSEDNPAGH